MSIADCPKYQISKNVWSKGVKISSRWEEFKVLYNPVTLEDLCFYILHTTVKEKLYCHITKLPPKDVWIMKLCWNKTKCMCFDVPIFKTWRDAQGRHLL
jgi:hypothetical protein